MRQAESVMDASLANALDRYAATSGHRLVKEILAEHEADLFGPPAPGAPGKRHHLETRQPQLYWVERD